MGTKGDARNWCHNAYEALSNWYRHGAGDEEAEEVWAEYARANVECAVCSCSLTDDEVRCVDCADGDPGEEEQ